MTVRKVFAAVAVIVLVISSTVAGCKGAQDIIQPNGLMKDALVS